MRTSLRSCRSFVPRTFCSTILMRCIAPFALHLAIVAQTSQLQGQDAANTVVQMLGSPVFSSWEDANKGYADADLILRLEVARHRLAAISNTNSNFDSFLRARLAELRQANSLLQQIQQLDQRSPDLIGLGISLAAASPALGKQADGMLWGRPQQLTANEQSALYGFQSKFTEELVKGLWNAYELQNRRSDWRECYRACRTSALKVEQFLEASHSSKPANNTAIQADLNGSFAGFYVADYLFVTNTAGQRLTDVLLFVDLEGLHGSAGTTNHDHHMHSIAEWGPGETRILRYNSTAFSGLADDESVDHITSVSMRLYSEQLTSRVQLSYDESAYREDIQRYLGDLPLTASWYSYPPQHLLYDSGVQIRHTNGWQFPCTFASIEASGAAGSRSVRFDLRGRFDGDEWLSSEQFDGLQVRNVIVTFEFPWTSWTHQVQFSFEEP